MDLVFERGVEKLCKKDGGILSKRSWARFQKRDVPPKNRQLGATSWIRTSRSDTNCIKKNMFDLSFTSSPSSVFLGGASTSFCEDYWEIHRFWRHCHPGVPSRKLGLDFPPTNLWRWGRGVDSVSGPYIILQGLIKIMKSVVMTEENECVFIIGECRPKCSVLTLVMVCLFW